MPKRMVDTNLWYDEDIVENFTAEDKYFWLYLLTNPHNDICGVLKYAPMVIARDMGYHKDCIVNLIYRFETIHNLVYVDKEAKEIFILNWYKWNWTKSPKIISLIDKELNNIKSDTIKGMIKDRKDRVLIGYIYPPNANSDTISITNATNSNSLSSNKESNNCFGNSIDYNPDEIF